MKNTGFCFDSERLFLFISVASLVLNNLRTQPRVFSNIITKILICMTQCGL